MSDHDATDDESPEMPLAFDEAGRPCAVTLPVYDEPEEPSESCADAGAVIVEFVRLMTQDATALQTGQRLHVLAYLSGLTEYKTQRELALALNVSPGRVTQILQCLPSEFESICRLKRRTAKRRAIGEEE